MSFLSHLECAMCGKELEADRLWNLCPACGKPLLARYDLERASRAISQEVIAGREANLWRYRELLPVRNPRHVLCLGEGFTPLVHATRLGQAVGFDNLFIKDEGLNPTASFKARGLSVAVSRARELGVKAVSIPSAGNAASAMSAYAALAEMQAYQGLCSLFWTAAPVGQLPPRKLSKSPFSGIQWGKSTPTAPSCLCLWGSEILDR